MCTLILYGAIGMFRDAVIILSEISFFVRPKSPISSKISCTFLIFVKNCVFRFFVQNAKFRYFVSLSFKTNSLCRYWKCLRFTEDRHAGDCECRHSLTDCPVKRPIQQRACAAPYLLWLGICHAQSIVGPTT